MFGFSKKTRLIDTTVSKIDELLTRGVEEIFVRDAMRGALLSGRQLRIKLGFDPTGSDIHIGRAIILRKLRAFQDLGHIVVFIVGDFTAQIGDPSDKLEKRPMLTSAEIKKNLTRYKEQVGKIIDISKAEFCFNSVWLAKLGFQEISEIAESFSVQQMSNRRNFKERFEKGEEVSLREFLYPLMQGYDSVVVNADIEIGGFDQLFNLKAGRSVQKHFGKREQNIMTLKMLLGTDGRKMSTSWGNVINITAAPNDMFGKVMSVRDDLIVDYLLLCTNRTLAEIETVKTGMAEGKNPRDFKIGLAKDIVTLYHGAGAAEKAAHAFTAVFQSGSLPEQIKKTSVASGTLLADCLLAEKVVASKSEFRRLAMEGAVSNAETKEKITDPYYKLEHSFIVRVGPLRFLEILVH